jgi:hypothetical protein
MICTDTLLGTATRISSKLQAISYAKSSSTTVPAFAHRLNALGRSSSVALVLVDVDKAPRLAF